MLSGVGRIVVSICDFICFDVRLLLSTQLFPRKHAYSNILNIIYIVKLGFTVVYIIFLISVQKHKLWVTRKNRLVQAVLTSTHNLCFEQQYEKYQSFLSDFFQLLVVKFTVYLNRHAIVMCMAVIASVPLYLIIVCSHIVFLVPWEGGVSRMWPFMDSSIYMFYLSDKTRPLLLFLYLHLFKLSSFHLYST